MAFQKKKLNKILGMNERFCIIAGMKKVMVAVDMGELEIIPKEKNKQDTWYE
jgi:hypothetical protein